MPLDFKITPLSAFYWFLGDGSTIFKHRKTIKSNGIGVGLTFCTDSFDVSEVEWLIEEWKKIDPNLSFNKQRHLCYTSNEVIDKIGCSGIL